MNREHRRWHVTAFRLDGSEPEALRRVRELRARILFDRGRRPDFATHGDDQELDLRAWHFLAQDEPGGPPLGYVRLSTPDTAHWFQSRAFLGPDWYTHVLREHGFTEAGTFEHSRLVVEHRARKLGLGLYLKAFAIAAARSLGATGMIATSGTKDGQDRFHQRFGFRPVGETRRYEPRYAEDVVVMTHRIADGAGDFEDLVASLHPRLAAVPRWTTTRPAEAPAGLTATPAHEGWRPVLFRPVHVDERTALGTLTESGQVLETHDTIDTQLIELVRAREPWLAPADARRAVVEQLDGIPAWQYGTWAWYPWTRRLVHLLPRAEFRLVRTDRNRGKVSRTRQRELLDRRIGVIGLSVGNSAAITMALEGVGGAFRLADVDDVSLSNLNRLRAGVHDVGVAKAVICARQLAEIDPYLEVEIHPGGLTEDNLHEFFTGGAGQVDLLVEECDTPFAKIAARERARELRVPVLMDCDDRGMLDVERFDLEPDRPILHGRLGALKSGDVATMTRAEQTGLILAMVDVDRISPQLAASFPEVGRTLSSWPQLASGVALGGALVTDAARRILLGQRCASGRYYTDFDELLAPERDTSGVR
jgi:GNAT superfamily N-acetyltransferase